MKTLKTLIIILLFGALLSAQTRKSELINFDWKFKVGEQIDAYQTSYNDNNWETVNLPHDVSIFGPFIKDTLPGKNSYGFLPRHIGWYRKNLIITENLTNKKVFLEFEGVYRDAKVWLNGKQIGSNLNGYLDFELDITNYLISGINIIAVRYNNTGQLSSRWYTGEGINRNVWLHIMDNLHVDRYGTYITTPVITDKSARVKLETTIQNSYKDSVQCKLQSEIVSPDGKVVATTVSVVPLSGNEKFTFHQELTIPNPQLWEIDSPNLYHVNSYVFNDKKLKDQYETSFGVRDIVMNSTDGLLLNGHKVFVKGVCLHHDLGPLGASSFEAGYNRRLERLKELGCNGVRLSHNPYPKYVLDWCDKNGLLVFDEVYDKWSSQFYGQENNFEDYWRTDVETWLKRDRNHPSVFIWSVGNEVGQTWKSPQYNFKTKKMELDSTFGVRLLKEMTDFVRKIEPSRKITTALYPIRYNGMKKTEKGSLEAGPPQAAFYSDVMSVNYMQTYFAYDRQKYPQLIYILSEANTGTGGYSYFEYDRKSAVGQFYWGGTEYIGESFKWPSKGWINGMIDLCDNVKPIGYSIKSFYCEKPMVQIVVQDKSKANEMMWNDLKMRSEPMFIHWNWTAPQRLNVLTFSNCEEIELVLNSKSIGKKKMADYPMQKMTWEVDYEPGEIKAIGYNKGIKVTENILKTADKPYKVLLKPEKSALSANGLDLLYINVEIVDNAGNLVPINDINVRFHLNGTATIAGVGNGDITSDESWQANNRTVYQGRALLILRSTRDAGEISVQATSGNLQGAVLKTKSVK